MIFGDEADFGIEADVEPDLVSPSAVWGRMRVWCRNLPLGDIGLRTCALYPAYCRFAWLAENLDDLWDERLHGLSDEQMLSFFDRLLYGYCADEAVEDTRTRAEVRRDWACWNRFDFLTNVGEQFDGCKAFIVCPPDGSARILSWEWPALSGRSIRVTRGALQSASTGFVRWFEDQAARLNE